MQILFQTEGNILEYFLNAVVPMPGFISIEKRRHMWVGALNVLTGLRLKLARAGLTVGFSE